MKKRTSQKILRPNRKIASSVKQLQLHNTGSDSLKAPKKRVQRKNRQFGDDITNLPKQDVSQPIQDKVLGLSLEQTTSKISQIEPYLQEIGHHIRKLDEQYNMNILAKLSVKCPDSTEVTLDMRKILVKWIIQVGQKFRASQQTVHICVQIIDYILIFSHKTITKSNFQLLGIAALFVASKYNEIYTPEAKKYIYVCDGLYTIQNLFEMESYILTLTNFNLQFPILDNFIEPLINGENLSQEFHRIMNQLKTYIVMDFNLFNRFKKVHLSGVIAFFSAKVTNTQNFDAKLMMQMLNMDEVTFKNCLSNVISVYKQYMKPTLLNPQDKNE